MTVTGSESIGNDTLNSGNVADSESGGIATLNSGNASSQVDAEMAALIRAQRLTAEERHRRYDAQWRGALCTRCDRELSGDEPKFWVGPGGPYIVNGYPHHGWVCRDCAPKQLLEVKPGRWVRLFGERITHYVSRLPCETCGRELILQETPAQDRLRKHVLCSERCSKRYYNAQRRERTAPSREKTCEVCGEEFTASRSDAKTCSKACKQKAYRDRSRIAPPHGSVGTLQ